MGLYEIGCSSFPSCIALSIFPSIMCLSGKQCNCSSSCGIQLYKSMREVSKFATIALVDMDSDDIQVYVKYFDITLIPSTVFFFNAHHMKMDCRTADHSKWVGAFHRKQDFIDVVE
ncbi:OLC1v1024661C3 [Oldenlandia corymbosa var. corymbosa]|nr:OLC1v1024661C3 [Oldenlandia corymbosa var. corymbosa]